MEETLDDLSVPWTQHGPQLARLMLALADELEEYAHLDPTITAEQIRDVIRCDYRPKEQPRPQLGDPPTLRPAVPREMKPEVGS
jgi:hypothetical protein